MKGTNQTNENGEKIISIPHSETDKDFKELYERLCLEICRAFKIPKRFSIPDEKRRYE